jgi:hypothetical protein
MTMKSPEMTTMRRHVRAGGSAVLRADEHAATQVFVSTRSTRRAIAVFLTVALLLALTPPQSAMATGSSHPVRATPVLSAAELLSWWESRVPATICNRSVTVDGVWTCEERVAYEFRAGGGTITPRNLIDLYYAEGAKEDITPDIAFMQAILETAWFYYPDSGQVRSTYNNFAGMGAFDSGTHQPFRFPDPQTGVRAQLQHLRIYADPFTATDGSNLGSVLAQDVDGRYPDRWRTVRNMMDASGNYRFAGQAQTWESFGNGMWASDPAYSTKTLDLYRHALAFNGYPTDAATSDARIAPVGPRSPMMSGVVVSVPLVGDWDGDGRVSAGWRVGDRFYLEGGGAGGSDVVVRFGRASDVPFVGDWNGDGVTTVGVRRGDRWLLRNANTEGPADHDFVFGRASDAVGVVGDWNGDGRTSVGFWRPGGFWSLRNDLSAGMGDERFTFGMAEDARPVVGDWNGDGRTTVGFWRPGGFWSLRNHHSAGWGDERFTFGRAEDARPVVGDWNGDGRVTVGAVSGDEWLLRDRHAAGSRDGTWWFGAGPSTALMGDWNADGRQTPGWKIGQFFHLVAGGADGSDVSVRYGLQRGDVGVAGDWNGDGRTTIGVRRGDEWLLRNSNTAGYADHVFRFGRASDAVGVVGDWNGDGRDSVGFWRPGGFWSLRNDLSAGMGDYRFTFGRAEDARPVVGDWNADGRTTVGFRRPGGYWSLRNRHGAGTGDHRFSFGLQPQDEGFVGDWNGDGRTSVGVRRDNRWLLRDPHTAGTATYTHHFNR